MSGERLYAVDNCNLIVYSLRGDLKSPYATYQLASDCKSGILTEYDRRLYLGGAHKLIVFQETYSITQPLTEIKVIDT